MENNTTENGDEKKEEGEDEPKIYGDYEILKPIGRGKFAVVYRAKRISDDKIVALKRISVDMIDENARDKCLKEVRLLQSLDHPNIIKYYDSFINETDQLIIIVEWAAAGDLKRQLRKAQEKQVGFEERIIWKYFSQIADAIQHMHERRIMHRDLKPANILLTLDGTVKVGDLGLSRELSENTYQAHSKVGTPLYMSPEVLRGDGYDFKTDIWSIGCLLYELAMLKSPFKAEGQNMFSLFQKISQGEYSPLPERYSEELRNLAYAMISTDPTDRPDIADICDISRQMRLKYNEEYAKEKKIQNNQKSLTQTITSTSPITLEEAPKNIEGGAISSRPSTRNQAPEDSDENQEANGQHYPNKNVSTTAKSSNYSNDLPPKIVDHPDKRISSNPPRASYGGDSDDSDATQDRKSKKKLNELTSEKEHKSPIGSSNRRSGGGGGSNQASLRDDVKGWDQQQQQHQQQQQYQNHHQHQHQHQLHADNKQSNKVTQKPNFPKRSSVEERDETYIPYTSLPTHEQPTSRQSAPIGQPSHRRVKQKPQEHENSNGIKRDINDNIQQHHHDSEPLVNEQHSKKSAILENVGGSIALMELIYSKLSVLGYPVSNQSLGISTLHFVCELGLLYGNRNRILFPSTQFGRFVEVCLWLIEHSAPEKIVPGIDIDLDPPPMIVKRLLNLSQDCGISPSILADISPSSLVQGYGEKACLFLNILADCAMKFQKHNWREFVYPVDTIATTLSSQQLESEIDDVLEEDVEEHAENILEGERSTDTLSSRNLQRSVIFSNIDSVRWKEETERVASSLKSSLRDKSKGSIGWVSNIETLKQYSSKTKNSVSGGDVNGGEGIGSGQEEVVDISTMSLVEMISLLQKSLLDGLSGISRVESMMNSNNSLSSLAVEYASIHEKLRALEERQKECTKNVAVNSNRLGEIQEVLQEALEELGTKTGETDSSDGNSMILNLKRAIKSLKEENKDLHLRGGLLQCEILNIRKAVVSEKARHRKTRSKRRSKE